MTAPAGGNELGTVFINVAPKMSGLSNQFLAAGREGAKAFNQGFTEGMKDVSLPADGSILGEVIAGKPVGTATRTAAQKAGKEIGTGLNQGINEGMKTAPSTGGGVIGDVLAGKTGGWATQNAAIDAGKTIGAGINKGIQEAAKDNKIEDIIVPESGGLKEALKSIAKEAGETMMDELGKQIKAAGGPEQAFQNLLDNLDDMVGRSAPILQEFGVDVTGVRDVFGEMSSYAEKAAPAINLIADNLGPIKDALASAAPSAKKFADNIKDWPDKLGEIGPKLKDVAGSLKGAFSGDVAGKAQTIADTFGQINPLAQQLGINLGPVGEKMDQIAATAQGVAGVAEAFSALQGIGWAGMAAGLFEVAAPLGAIAALAYLIQDIPAGLKREQEELNRMAATPTTPAQQAPFQPPPALPGPGKPIPPPPALAGPQLAMLEDIVAGTGPAGRAATPDEKQQALTLLKDRAARGDTEAQTFLKQQHISYQHGGTITGSGDEVAIRAHVGEYVMPVKQTAQFRPLLDAMRSYQTGGLVTLNTTGAQVDTIAIGKAVQQMFGITNMGFYRAPDGYNEHSSGEAVDVMISDKRVGDAVKNFALAHAGDYGVMYCLWQQQQWNPDGSSSMMADRGSPTQNHMDHVHIRTHGGGYPPGGGPGGAGAGSMPAGTSGTPAPAAMAGYSGAAAVGAQAGAVSGAAAGAAAGGGGGTAGSLGGNIINLHMPGAIVAGHGAAQELSNMAGPSGPASSALPPSAGGQGLPPAK
jgi:hypothetical protein